MLDYDCDLNSGFQSFVQKTWNYIWTFHGISHLFPIEEKIHLVNSDKSIAPVASTGGVADGVVTRGEAGEHTCENHQVNNAVSKNSNSGFLPVLRSS